MDECLDGWLDVGWGGISINRQHRYPMSRLNCSHQVEPLPDVNVPVESSRICDVIFGRRDAEDGLQVAHPAKDAPLWCESVSTQRPELRDESGTHRIVTQEVTGHKHQQHAEMLFVNKNCLY